MTAKAKVDLIDRLRQKEVKGHKYRVAEWDEDVELRSMTILQKEKLGDLSEETAKFVPAVLVATCFDPATGEPLFTDADADWLTEQPASAIEPLLFEALKVSGLSESQLEKAIDSGKDAS